MDKLVGWNMRAGKSNLCSNCGMKKDVAAKKGCCKEEHKQLKLLHDQKVTELSGNQVYLPSLAVLIDFNAYMYKALSAAAECIPVSHAPPEVYCTDICLFYCVFRI